MSFRTARRGIIAFRRRFSGNFGLASVAWVIRGQATATRLVIRHGSRMPTCPSGGNQYGSGARRAERFG
jgi:hypothetical protein